MTMNLMNKKGKKYDYHESELIERDDNRYLMKINDVLSQDECNVLIGHTENIGYTNASLYTTKSGKEVFDDRTRKSQRCIIDSEEFVKDLYQRIKHYIPHEYPSLYLHFTL
jgi:hypothetical protein